MSHVNKEKTEAKGSSCAVLSLNNYINVQSNGLNLHFCYLEHLSISNLRCVTRCSMDKFEKRLKKKDEEVGSIVF